MDTRMKRIWVPLLVFVFLLTSLVGSFGSFSDADLSTRTAAVAGRFYPGEPQALRKQVAHLLEKGSGKTLAGDIRALVLPHAGYRYSGIVAAAGYRQVEDDVDRVILLGPSHRVRLKGASIAEVAAYETPLGSVALDPLASTLRRSPLFHATEDPHRKEHSLEVQLPFLQVRLGTFTIVPILTNDTDPARLAATLSPHVNEATLIIASSDLSHYHPYTEAVSLDRQCIRAITSMDLSGVETCEACGKEAVLTLMHLARIKGWNARLIDYKNSGDTGGGNDRVVGYASIAFLGGKERQARMERNDLSYEDKVSLLKLARSAIESKLGTGRQVIRPKSPAPALLEDRGCFVTLHKNGRLRGCIGSIEPVSTLLACIEEHAVSAAFHDPRFPPVTVEELESVDIEISVLTVPEDLAFTSGENLKAQLEPDIHGVILSSGLRKSTFLPQVWEQLPDKEAFLHHLCIKGGMAGDAWRNPSTKVQVYKAEAFGEKDTDLHTGSTGSS